MKLITKDLTLLIPHGWWGKLNGEGPVYHDNAADEHTLAFVPFESIGEEVVYETDNRIRLEGMTNAVIRFNETNKL